MSSHFRSRRNDETTPPRSGGKILRRRKRTTPSPSPYARPPESTPAAAQLGSPKWLSGLISGAGKLFSSVLPTRVSSSPASPSSDYSSSSEEANSEFDGDEEEHCRLDQKGKESENKCMDGPLAIISRNDTKVAIEQMVMKETFTRAECDRLTRLIQSRVINSPSQEICGNETEEFPSTTPRHVTPIREASLSFGLKQVLSERVPHSPQSFVFEACMPDVHNKAIMEAKKWLEVKKSMSKPKYDSECGPCTLNTEHGFDSNGDSPVDVAKSYMRSLPPWRFPSFSGIGFKTPPSRMHRFRDEMSFETSSYNLPSSKERKRDHLNFENLDTLDETRRVRMRGTDDRLEISKSKQAELLSGTSEHESYKLLGTDREESHVEDCCLDGEGNANHPFKTVNINSLNIISETEEIIHTVQATPEISVSKTHSLETSQHLDETQPSQSTERVDKNSVTHDTRSLEHERNPSSEIDVIATENKESAVPSDGDADENLNDVKTSAHQMSMGVEDPRPQDGNFHTLKKTKGSMIEASTDGSSVEVHVNSVNEAPNKATHKVAPQNGTKMKSIERMPTQPKETTTRRGRKAVVKSRRGRKS